MTLAEQLKFMFTTLHGGAVNLTLHIASLPVIIMGLIQRRASLIVLGAALEVAGHAYNYLVRFDDEQRSKARNVFPVQGGISLVVFGSLLKLFGWF
jgi:hypothetical protein